jgi:hypothetical protein
LNDQLVTAFQRRNAVSLATIAGIQDGYPLMQGLAQSFSALQLAARSDRLKRRQVFGRTEHNFQTKRSNH